MAYPFKYPWKDFKAEIALEMHQSNFFQFRSDPARLMISADTK